MQTITTYYYPNSVDVQWNSDPTITLRNRVMYQRTVKLYRGVDNFIRFSFKNPDQQAVNITGWNIWFHMTSDEEGSVLVSKSITTDVFVGNTTVTVPNGITAVDLVGGVIVVKVGDFDLIDLDNEYYHYSLSVVDNYNLTDPSSPYYRTEQVVYADDNYDVRGEIRLLSGHYPTFNKSINVQLPTDSNTNVITSTVTADTPTRQQSAHHTAQFYFNNAANVALGFTGNISVQGTLDSLPPLGNTGGNTPLSWATISTLSYTNQVNTDYWNFDGVFTACRFIITPANTSPLSGNVSTILYRA